MIKGFFPVFVGPTVLLLLFQTFDDIMRRDDDYGGCVLEFQPLVAWRCWAVAVVVSPSKNPALSQRQIETRTVPQITH